MIGLARLARALSRGGTVILVAAIIAGSSSWPRSGEAATAAQGVVLSPDAIATLTRVEAYLNQIQSLRSRFVQIASNGSYAEGEVAVARPGRLRFDYDPPHTALIIANGLSLLYYDRELKQASFLPLWETPLWFLVREVVRLDEEVEVTEIGEALGTLSVSLRERENPERGTVTLVFSDEPLTLRRWEVLDSQGVLTQVSLINPLFGIELDSTIFDYSDLEINAGQRNIDK